MQPHILIFNPDQWRGDVLGHMGNPGAVTPILDEWVQNDAVSFRWAFCQNPVCTPSRCSFMTGWYPHVRGHRTMFHMLQPDEPMLLRDLKAQGYFVWWGGKNDVVPAQQGFADFCDVKYQPQEPIRPNPHQWDAWRGTPDGDNYYSFYLGCLDTDEDEIYYDGDWAMIHGAIEQIKNRPPHQPLCIYLPLSYPHPPYAVETPWHSLIDRSALPPRIPQPENWAGKPKLLAGIAERQNLQGWTEDRWTELRATYYGMCARVDHQFGLVLEALRETGIYDETAVFFFSDHGDFTGDYGLVEKTQNTFEDCLTRVPFAIKPPKNCPVQPHVSDALVELIDFPATVYDMTGIPPAHTHFGRSLLPVLAGDRDTHREAVFCEGGRILGETQAMETEANIHKNKASLYWPRVSLQAIEDGSHTKAAMCRTKDHKYIHRLYETDELYDLNADPAELHNRIDDPACAPVRNDLRLRLLQWYQETADVVPSTPDLRE